MQYREVVQRLKAHANADNVAGMARYGINPHNTLGVSIPYLRALAKECGKDHALALKLWDSGIHEARILASMVAEKDKVTRSMMDSWARDFDSWDVCDQVCGNLFRHTPHARDKAMQWSGRKQAFVKRAAFSLMAGMVVADKQASDESFLPFLEIIEREAHDERNFVKKAVNWALRSIGKRNRALNKQAVATARRILKQESKAARWVARDALRELTDEKVVARLKS
jgi:3-methyladenine DNA glycosylase AlkD